ncbi:sorbose reductase sou1 [Infundibulicybe gibba]|nr:sorbose reductase sou1 [Infundibulicybe gibba]
MYNRNTAPIGVAAALASGPPVRTALTQFSLSGRVALVTGGHRGIGLEMALALTEAGAIVYCLDLPSIPEPDWLTVQAYAEKLPLTDVTNQEAMWQIVRDIVEKEGRIDVCMANAGIFQGEECLEYPADQFKKLIDVNVNGVLYTAQAAGREMVCLRIPGSIILTASMSGSITNKDIHCVAYNTSKSAVIQMARSLACELGVKGIRVNSISPGHILTPMMYAYLDANPHMADSLSKQNPLGRLARPDELRGVVLWLAGDASTFCTGSEYVSVLRNSRMSKQASKRGG